MALSPDRMVPAGQKPFKGMPIFAPEEQGTDILSRFFQRLKLFFMNNVVYTVPRPFRYWVAYEITLAAGDTWVDQRVYLKGRRAWALVNHNAVAGNFVYVNSHAMTAIGQGGRVYPTGGSFSAPIGYGDNSQQVHALPVAAGTVISFYQFA